MKTQFAYQGPTLAPVVLLATSATNPSTTTKLPTILAVSQKPATRLGHRYLPLKSGHGQSAKAPLVIKPQVASPFMLLSTASPIQRSAAAPGSGVRVTQLVAETLSASGTNSRSLPRGRARLLADAAQQVNQDEIEEALDIIFPTEFPPLISPTDEPASGIKAYGASGLIGNTRQFPASFGP